MTYRRLDRQMRRDVCEYGTRIDWRELYLSVREGHLMLYLEQAGAMQTLCDALNSMDAAMPNKCEEELRRALFGAGDAKAFLFTALYRECGATLSQRWQTAQERELASRGIDRDEPYAFDPVEDDRDE